jgi:FKBP-type peptidyl-prolyl cis-trans isomerase FkpA
VPIRLASLLVLALALAASGCSQEEAAPAPAADAATVRETPPSKNAGKPGAPDGSPFSVTHEVEGTGASPTASDFVTVHYAGRLADGSQFDSSYERGAPATFALSGVIRCWTEGVAQMRVGGKATLVCPPDMAYGAEGKPPIPPNATLTFDVELLGIEPPLQ